MRRFVGGTVLAVLILAVGSIAVSCRAGQAEAIRDAREHTVLIGFGTLEPALGPGVLAGDAEALAQLDAVVRRSVLDDSLVRVKIWSTDGRLVYSDAPELLADAPPLGADGLAVLLTGEVDAEVSDLSDAENRFERPFGKLLEVYAPVTAPTGERFLFESYHRYDSVTAGSRRLWLSFAPVMLASLGLMGLVQIPFAVAMARGIEQGQREREQLLRRAIDASTQERRRIAAYLHDGVVQDLAGIALEMSVVGGADEPDRDDEVRGTLRRGAEGLRRGMGALRTLLVELYPPNLQDEGLEAALADLVAPLDGRGIRASLAINLPGRLPAELEELVFRAAQEAIRNVVAHAGARSVEVSLTAGGGEAVLEVRDDGAGFSVAAWERAPAEGHLGLRLQRARVEERGGRLEIRSAPGDGSTVHVTVPLP